MKKILFPTDFSPAADNAFRYALRVAEEIEASLIVLHVYQLPQIRGASRLPNTMQQVYESMRIEEFKNFEDNIPYLKQMAEDYGLGDIPIDYVMEHRETVRGILMVAREKEVDMIVMGTTGASGLKELFIGSVAGEVLEHAACSVLAIPEKAEFDGEIDKIAVTTSFKEEEKKAIRRVLDFAANFSAEVYCVNVDVGHTEFFAKKMEVLKDDFKGVPNLHFVVLHDGTIKNALSKFLEENSIDILAMLTHRRNFIEELFRFSRTKKMAYHAKTPILAIQAHTLS